MRTLIFQHTPEENPGTLSEWLEAKKFPNEIFHVYRDALPSPDKFEWLVVLGGPMNVSEEEKFPWLKAEKKFLSAWVKSGKPVLGICLGGQLLAEVLGGRVAKNAVREIGFHEVHRTGATHPALRAWPPSLAVFQWHEDRFSLPPGCVSLLTSPACEHQAFALNEKTLGLQFHPESTEAWIEGNYEGFAPEPGEPLVQPREECARLMPDRLPALRAQFFQLLTDFTRA
jgi:GMP synthase-like glutamine amidotransferase